MSYDFALAKICDHRVRDELCNLDSTRVYARLARSPSTDDIEVRVNGVNVPKGGFVTTPEILFNAPGPYKIIKQFNDLLYLRVIPINETYSIRLPSGDAITAEQVARSIIRSLSNPELTVLVNDGKIAIRSVVPKLGSYMKMVDPTILDQDEVEHDTHVVMRTYSMFGISPGKVASGRKTIPGWSLVNQNNSDYQDPGVLFETPLPNSAPVVSFSYPCLAHTCGRCEGSLLEFDYTIVEHGYETVRDLDLLVQESDKFLFTKKGSHFKWPWLGSTIIDSVGVKNSSGMGTTLQLSIQNAFNIYKNIKLQQDRDFPTQNVTDLEFPKSLTNFSVSSDANDPTASLVNLTVSSRSSDYSSYSRSISTPNPFSRLGNLQNNIFGSSSGYILR